MSLTLTPAGERVLDTLLMARRAALAALLEPLAPAELDGIAGLLESVLAARVHDRADLERVCRLCERRACERARWAARWTGS